MPPTEIQWIAQEHAHGCGLAALAMISRRAYADLHAELATKLGRDFNARGITIEEARTWLHEHGYRTEVRQSREPFAPGHLLSVTGPIGSRHLAVMDGDGRLLDPADASRSWNDFKVVESVCGVWPHTTETTRRKTMINHLTEPLERLRKARHDIEGAIQKALAAVDHIYKSHGSPTTGLHATWAGGMRHHLGRALAGYRSDKTAVAHGSLGKSDYRSDIAKAIALDSQYHQDCLAMGESNKEMMAESLARLNSEQHTHDNFTLDDTRGTTAADVLGHRYNLVPEVDRAVVQAQRSLALSKAGKVTGI